MDYSLYDESLKSIDETKETLLEKDIMVSLSDILLSTIFVFPRSQGITNSGGLSVCPPGLRSILLQPLKN